MSSHMIQLLQHSQLKPIVPLAHDQHDVQMLLQPALQQKHVLYMQNVNIIKITIPIVWYE